jgi:hypothetical protein
MRDEAPAKRAERAGAVPVGGDSRDGLGRGHVPAKRELGGVDLVDIKQTSQEVQGCDGGGPAAHVARLPPRSRGAATAA